MRQRKSAFKIRKLNSARAAWAARPQGNVSCATTQKEL